MPQDPSLPASKNPQRYRLYIDESGDHTFDYVDQGNHRYLCLLGVWFRQDEDYSDFADALLALKKTHLKAHPDEPICLHRKDLMHARGSFWRLRDPRIRAEFDQSLIRLVANANFVICAVLLDKQEHKSKTYRTLFHPYHYCLAALLERYAGWLHFHKAIGDVMAESRGGSEDRELRGSFESTLREGTRFHGGGWFASVLTSKKLKLKKKEHAIPGLELADLLAHPSRRSMIGEDQERERSYDDFGARLLHAADIKFNRREYDGRVSGYGKVFLK